MQHSNISPIYALARRLYTEQTNKCIPSWDQLVHFGATQSAWIQQAEKIMLLQDAK